MRCQLFHLLPEIFNGIEVGGIGRQLHLGQALGMGFEKLRHSFARVITRPILNDKDMLRGLPQDIEQKGGIAFGVEPPRLGFIEGKCSHHNLTVKTSASYSVI